MRSPRQNAVILTRNHFQAAAILMEELGGEAEGEILHYLSELAQQHNQTAMQ